MFSTYDTDLKATGTMLRKNRKEKNLSQQKLYKEIFNNDNPDGRTTISNWERQGITKTYELLTLCNYFKTDVDAFLGRTTIKSKDMDAIMSVTGLNENAIGVLENNEYNANFLNYILTVTYGNNSKENIFNEMTRHIKTLANSQILYDVLKSAFDPFLINKIKEWYENFYSSCFPMDMSNEKFLDYIRSQYKFDGEETYFRHFLSDGVTYTKNYILNEFGIEDFDKISEKDKYTIVTDVITQISYDYMSSTKVMVLSRQKIIDTFADMLDGFIKDEDIKFHFHTAELATL